MTTLGELSLAGGIQTGPFGSQLHADEYTDEGVGVVMPQDIGENTLDFSTMAHISADKAAVLVRHRLEPGDIIYSRRGDVTRRSLVRELDPPLICGTGCLRVRLDATRANPTYVSYALGDAATRAWITRHAVGATMLNLNTKILAALPLSLPGKPQQDAIAEVLGALDDKIAANRRVVDSSDALRAALWRKLCAGAPTRPLSDVARFINGRAFTKDASGTGRVVVRIAELNSGVGSSTVRNDIAVADDHLARPGDLLMAWSGSLTAARWYRDEAIVNQHIFKVIPNSDHSMWSVACAVDTKMADFKHEAAGKATTMGHIQRRHLDEPVRWPVLTDADESGGAGLWNRALTAEMENETLAKTRDELLPLLMSGKITVQDAEKTVEGVV